MASKISSDEEAIFEDLRKELKSLASKKATLLQENRRLKSKFSTDDGKNEPSRLQSLEQLSAETIESLKSYFKMIRDEIAELERENVQLLEDEKIRGGDEQNKTSTWQKPQIPNSLSLQSWSERSDEVNGPDRCKRKKEPSESVEKSPEQTPIIQKTVEPKISKDFEHKTGKALNTERLPTEEDDKLSERKDEKKPSLWGKFTGLFKDDGQQNSLSNLDEFGRYATIVEKSRSRSAL